MTHAGMRTAGSIRIVVAGFGDVVGAGLQLCLATDPGFEVVAWPAEDGPLNELLRQHAPEVLIIPGYRLIASQETSDADALGRTSVVVLESGMTKQRATRLLAHGASACLPLNVRVRDLVNSVDIAMRGGHVVLEEPDDGAPDAEARFGMTSRETEVHELLRRGWTNGQIAQELCISPHTAHTHVNRVLKKLGVRSRRELV
jgi:DNA-binding NarL/FixJ family response regulator